MLRHPRVIFGPEIWSLQSEGGISRYFQELIRSLSEIEVEGKILARANSNLRLSDLSVAGFQIQRLGDAKNSQKEIVAVLAKELNEKIFHPTYYSRQLAGYRSSSTKVFITVFDMISELFPEKRPRLRKSIDFKKTSVQEADHILCISEQTKNDLMDLFKVPEEKISVTYLGSRLHLLPQSNVSVSSLLSKNYILYVGKRMGYKNFSKFITAYSHSKSLVSSFSVVAVGGGNFTSDEILELEYLGLSNRVIQIEASDALLAMYYRNAACLVYPSIYEGFGLPPVEAMSLNCPVIASHGGSIPEICKDAAEYFDPTNLDSIEYAISSTLTNENRMYQMRQSGLSVAESYTWEKTALNTLVAYRGLI